MIFMGIGDEGANSIDGQILATQELGWKFLEPRGVEVPGFPKANLHCPYNKLEQTHHI